MRSHQRRSKPASLEVRPLKGIGEDEAWISDTTLSVTQPMEKVLHRLNLQERLHYEKILKLWPVLVGEFNAQHSFPELLKKKVLTIRVSNSPYLHQLNMIKPTLLKKIQDECKELKIAEIRLSI